MTLAEAFALPDRCRVEQRIPKRLYYENVQMSAAQKRLFKEELDRLTFIYRLSPDTLNIPAYVNDDHVYDDIAMIEARLYSLKHAKSIAEVVHKVPYPVILLLSQEKQTMLSLVPKRINRTDSSKRTIEEYIFTDWLDMSQPSEMQRHFLRSLDISKLSYENLHRLYADIISRITALQSADITGRFIVVENHASQRELLDEISILKMKMNELKSILKKESQFNEKVRLNMELKKLEASMEQKQQMLKEMF